MGIDHFIMHIYFETTNARHTSTHTKHKTQNKWEKNQKILSRKECVCLIWTAVVCFFFFLFHFVCSTDAITGCGCFLFTHVSEIHAPKSSPKSKPFAKQFEQTYWYPELVLSFWILVSKLNISFERTPNNCSLLHTTKAYITIISTDEWLKINVQTSEARLAFLFFFFFGRVTNQFGNCKIPNSNQITCLK